MKDEIQLISNDFRGSAWTNAVLGLQAKEIHLCGEERAAHLLWRLTQNTGDEIEFREYKRRTPLYVESKPFNLETDIAEGDCIITFNSKFASQLRNVVLLITRK